VNLRSQLQLGQQQMKELHEAHRKALQDHSKSQSAAQSTQSELHELRLALADLQVPCSPAQAQTHFLGHTCSLSARFHQRLHWEQLE